MSVVDISSYCLFPLLLSIYWSLLSFNAAAVIVNGDRDINHRDGNDGIPPKMQYSGMTITNGVYCPNITFGSEIARQSLTRVHSLGTNWISVIVTQFQMTHNSTHIFPIYNHSIQGNLNHTCNTATDDDLRSIIHYAHTTLNMSVMLKPHIDLVSDHNNWRGTIGNGMGAAQWQLWFESYAAFILHYAALAQETQCEMLSVSTELILVSQQEQHWRQLVPKIRARYTHGLLTDAAHWSWPLPRDSNQSYVFPTNNTGELTDKAWWDLMDVIGCDEYYLGHIQFNLSNNSLYPTLAQYMEAWVPIQEQFGNLSAFYNKPLILTEIGACSGIQGACYGNTNAVPAIPTSMESLDNQRTLYESVLLAFAKYEWFQGIFWWNWVTDNAFGGANDSCLSPAYKPAEALLRQWYYATEPSPPPPKYPPLCDCWY